MDVLGGRIPIIIESLSALAGTLQDGSIKALAVTSPVRLANLSDLPTVAETLPGFAISGWFALLAPSGTPEWIVHKIAADLQAALGEAEISQKFETLGVHVRRMSPSDTTAFIRREQQLWKPIIAQAGLAAK
jgi:tripartite-type tricarboxylate transporter receptor subunit TctC